MSEFFNQLEPCGAWYCVKTQPQREAAEVPQAVIEVLRTETPEAGPIVIEDERVLKEGDEAVVSDGAMMGLRAVVTQVMPGGERVKILMDMMGTAVSAEVPLDTLEPLCG